MSGTCTLCGEKKQLTFEHVPPRAAGNNLPTRLYSGIDTIANDKPPWDFTGLKYQNAQRGSGGYYLCADCNSWTGVTYADALADMYKQALFQNVVPFYWSGAKSIAWRVRFNAIRPVNIAKQILVMIACNNGREFLRSQYGYEQLIVDKDHIPEAFDHSIQLFLNAGPLSVMYPPTARMRTDAKEPDLLTGVSTRLFGFQLELGSSRNRAGYCDITHWLTDYEYDECVDIELEIPVFQTYTMFPEDHRGKSEIEFARAENERLYPKDKR